MTFLLTKPFGCGETLYRVQVIVVDICKIWKVDSTTHVIILARYHNKEVVFGRLDRGSIRIQTFSRTQTVQSTIA